MAQQGVDVVIVGAGIVGLATAMDLATRRPDLQLMVLDKEDRIAAHQTGHNSGVIHAGLYYRPGSQKARLAVEGARQMIEFCEQHSLPYELCGKVVVALDEQEIPRLEDLYERGTANGVPGLVKIGPEQIQEREPHARGLVGLWSPKTGIVDYLAVTAKYAQIFEQAGGTLRLNTRVVSVEQRGSAAQGGHGSVQAPSTARGALIVHTNQGEFETRYLINCAGLQSDRIAKMMGSAEGLRIVPFRGEYYELAPAARRLVRGLIYPVPDPRFPFLGVHFTKRINGAVEAGPNAVLAMALEGYGKTDVRLDFLFGLITFPGFWVMASRYWRMGLGEMYRSWNKRAFVKALQKLVPELGLDDIKPGGAGVRAQAMDARGKLLDDFSIVETPHAVHVLNAPSPAATCSLPIGREIADRALAAFGLI